jgi:hypothetical protein
MIKTYKQNIILYKNKKRKLKDNFKKYSTLNIRMRNERERKEENNNTQLHI